MTDSDVDILGPVDYVVVEFPADRANFSGEARAELSALIDRGVVRVLDLLIIKKELDGSLDGFEAHDFGDDSLGELRELETEMAMLLAEEDVDAIGAALEPGSVAAVLIWENVWAAPFGPPSAGPVVSWWPAAGSRSNSWRPPSRRTRRSRVKEAEMLGRGRVGRRGVMGGRPVARTAAVVGTAAVVTHGVRRRGDRREDRRDDRRDRR